MVWGTTSFACATLRAQLVGLVGWSVGLLVNWSVGWLVVWLVRQLVGWLVGWLVGQLVGRLVGWTVDRLVSWLVGWLVGRSVGWLFGRLVGWLVGLLACCRAIFSTSPVTIWRVSLRYQLCADEPLILRLCISAQLATVTETERERAAVLWEENSYTQCKVWHLESRLWFVNRQNINRVNN
jgi:hypothetical protein